MTKTNHRLIKGKSSAPPLPNQRSTMTESSNKCDGCDAFLGKLVQFANCQDLRKILVDRAYALHMQKDCIIAVNAREICRISPCSDNIVVVHGADHYADIFTKCCSAHVDSAYVSEYIGSGKVKVCPENGKRITDP